MPKVVSSELKKQWEAVSTATGRFITAPGGGSPVKGCLTGDDASVFIIMLASVHAVVDARLRRWTTDVVSGKVQYAVDVHRALYSDKQRVVATSQEVVRAAKKRKPAELSVGAAVEILKAALSRTTALYCAHGDPLFELKEMSERDRAGSARDVPGLTKSECEALVARSSGRKRGRAPVDGDAEE